MSGLIAPRLLAQVQVSGTVAEQQLLRRWEDRVIAFLGAFEPGALRGDLRLEIGLESALVLKLVVKRARTTPAAGLDSLRGLLSPLQHQVLDQLLATGGDCHAGLRLSAERCHAEVYPYDPLGEIKRLLSADRPLPPTPPGWRVTAWGIDAETALSAYFTRESAAGVEALVAPAVQALEKELRHPVAEAVQDVWYHLRLAGDHWEKAKLGIELAPASLELVARVLSHYRPPHFRYLVPVRANRGLVLTGAIGSGMRGWYFTL